MIADPMLNDLLFAVLFLHIQLMPLYIPSKIVDSDFKFPDQFCLKCV